MSLLDSYEQERRSIADDVIKATRVATDQLEEFGELSAAERDRLYAHPVVTEAEQRRIARHREESPVRSRRPNTRDDLVTAREDVLDLHPQIGNRRPVHPDQLINSYKRLIVDA